MNNETLTLAIKTEVEGQCCPIHNIRPLLKIENGNITLRCCCDYFTSRCMAEIDSKLKGKQLNIVDAFEEDLYSRQLQVA
jgi:hypothetical protein